MDLIKIDYNCNLLKEKVNTYNSKPEIKSLYFYIFIYLYIIIMIKI